MFEMILMKFCENLYSLSLSLSLKSLSSNEISKRCYLEEKRRRIYRLCAFFCFYYYYYYLLITYLFLVLF